MKTHKSCYEMDENWEKNNRNSKILGGLLVIGAGALILIKQLGMPIPGFLLSWEMILIAIGSVMLVKHNFKKPGAYIMIAIGSVFLLHDFMPNVIEPKFIWPILIIALGISMILKPFTKKKAIVNDQSFSDIPKEDYVNSAAFFGGITKRVVTKNFQGATISSVFGGNEINLSQADFSNEVVIDVTCVFGGVNLIVPSHWKIKSDLTTVFGGIDDQRPASSDAGSEEEKTLILKGKCVFGGIEIHSYN